MRSSKATDIAHQCGFDKVVRIERGTAFTLSGKGVDSRPEVLAKLHDRMTESVLAKMDDADALFHHYAPQPLSSVDLRGRKKVRSVIRKLRKPSRPMARAWTIRTWPQAEEC